MLDEVRELFTALVEGRLTRHEAFEAAVAMLPRLEEQEHDPRWAHSAEDGLSLLCAAIETHAEDEPVFTVQDHQDWLDDPENGAPQN